MPRKRRTKTLSQKNLNKFDQDDPHYHLSAVTGTSHDQTDHRLLRLLQITGQQWTSLMTHHQHQHRLLLRCSQGEPLQHHEFLVRLLSLKSELGPLDHLRRPPE